MPVIKAKISKIKYVLKKSWFISSNDDIILPKAIEPTRKVINFNENIPISALNIPIKHINPIQKFKPPYRPAISECPSGDVTDKPITLRNEEYPKLRFWKTGSKIAQIPIHK